MARAERYRRQWPGWMGDLLEYGPIAELEPEWRSDIGDAITRVLDMRAGRIEHAKCERCGSLLTLHCTIVGCGLPGPSRWQRFVAYLKAWAA